MQTTVITPAEMKNYYGDDAYWMMREQFVVDEDFMRVANEIYLGWYVRDIYCLCNRWFRLTRHGRRKLRTIINNVLQAKDVSIKDVNEQFFEEPHNRTHTLGEEDTPLDFHMARFTLMLIRKMRKSYLDEVQEIYFSKCVIRNPSKGMMITTNMLPNGQVYTDKDYRDILIKFNSQVRTNPAFSDGRRIAMVCAIQLLNDTVRGFH